MWLIVRVYVRLFIRIYLCFLSECHCRFSTILSLIVYSVVPWFIFLCMFLSLSVNACITANIACVCTSLYPCFSLSLCVWMCIPVSDYIIIHSWCICTYLDPCFSLSFSVIVYICVRLYCHWLYVYRYVSYSTFLSISLSLCLSQCQGILLIKCMYVSKCIQVAQCVIALWKMYVLLFILRVYVRLLIRISLSLWLWMSVPVSGSVITDYMCIYVSWSCLFFSFSLEICSSVRLYCHWL